MSDGLWPVVTKEHPCPICGTGDWCTVGDRSIKCMRIESDHPCPSGGWYHMVGVTQRTNRPPPSRSKSGTLNCAKFMSALSGDSELRYVLARSLGVESIALGLLHAGWSEKDSAWAFPMRDSLGDIIGIRLRNNQGDKWAVRGSKAGLFFDVLEAPESWKGQTAYIVEGPTDTAACLTIGLKVIGKPSCNACNELVAMLLKRLRPRDVVILGDRDDKPNKLTGKPTNIGLVEARKLKESLNFRTLIVPPPMGFKDIREFVQNGGNRIILESLIKQYTWI